MLAFDTVLDGRHLRSVQWRRQDFRYKICGEIGADILRSCRAQDRENAPLAHRLLKAGHNVFHRERASREELFHQFVVALGDHLDQGLMCGGGGFLLGCRDLALLSLAVASAFVAMGFHADQINDSAEGFLRAEWQMHRHGARPKRS